MSTSHTTRGSEPVALNDGRLVSSTTHIPDVQAEPAEVNVVAGICDFQMVYQSRRWSFPVRVTILTPTQGHRGVHMSRLVAAAQKFSHGDYIEPSLRNMCKEVNRSQPGSMVVCELEYPYRDQFMPIRIEMAETGFIHYTLKRMGLTTCPCSKKIAGVGHTQRTSLTMEVRSAEILDFEEIAHQMDECFSANLQPFLKRLNEAELVMEAQANPRFVEDVVRECARRFPHAEKVVARSAESIHMHDAVAIWTRPS